MSEAQAQAQAQSTTAAAASDHARGHADGGSLDEDDSSAEPEEECTCRDGYEAEPEVVEQGTPPGETRHAVCIQCHDNVIVHALGATTVTMSSMVMMVLPLHLAHVRAG